MSESDDELRRLNEAIRWVEDNIFHPELSEEMYQQLLPRPDDMSPRAMFRGAVNRVLPEQPQAGPDPAETPAPAPEGAPGPEASGPPD